MQVVKPDADGRVQVGRRRRKVACKGVVITPDRILEWADKLMRRSKRWPTVRSGPIRGCGELTWNDVNESLQTTWRVYTTPTTLAQFLMLHRRKRWMASAILPTSFEILAWADAHFKKFGAWPNKSTTERANGTLSWSVIEKGLRRHPCDVPGAHTLAQLLAIKRGVRNPRDLPPFTIKRILQWADTHKRRTGYWPIKTSGPITPKSADTWAKVDTALYAGLRGLRGGSSLYQLLSTRRNYIRQNMRARPPLTIKQVLEWADKHFQRTGQWPTSRSGPIVGAKHETWMGIDGDLILGRRGLPGKTTLTWFLHQHRGKPYYNHKPIVTIAQIRNWARLHHKRTGRWPTQSSGRVIGAKGEIWGNIQSALYRGARGLPGGSSLAIVLAPFRRHEKNFRKTSVQPQPPKGRRRPNVKPRGSRSMAKNSSALPW